MKFQNVVNAIKHKTKKLNYKMCFIISFVLLVVGALISFVVHPQIVKIIIKHLCILKPGRFVRRKHEIRQQLTYKLFLWNVTNPNEITTGTEKPKLQEVGPYVFK